MVDEREDGSPGEAAGGRAVGAAVRAASGRQLRGSSLLLSGRGISLGIKLLTQLLLVRYLTTADYGSWAYALALVTLLGGFASLSLQRALTRFAAIYHERREYHRFFGTLLLVAGVILMTGTLFVLALYLFPQQAQALMGGRAEPVTLLFVLIFLVPIEALDHLCIATFATLGRAGAIFFRRYLLGPLLQLGAVLLLIGVQGHVLFMAGAYLGASALGAAVNGGLLLKLLAEDGLLGQFRARAVEFPVRTMFAFALPLMTGDWLEVLVQASGPLLLGHFAGPEEIALLRVAVTLALVSQVVPHSFDLLYVPAASRLFAAGDLAGVGALYGRTAFWVAVIAFPFFAATFAAATPLSVLLYGPRYAESGTLLAIMACGAYAKCALGFSTATLKVLGKVRYLAATNLLSAGVNVVLNLVLVPTLGVVGAAWALSGTLFFDAVVKHEYLRRATGLSVAAGRQRLAWGQLVAVALALVPLHFAGQDSLLLPGAVAVVASLLVLRLSRSALEVHTVFPELSRIPVLRAVLR